MKLTVVGTGYVGLVSAACFAEFGHEVVGVDIDAEKVQKLSSGKSTIYEPGLEELIVRGLKSKRLSFTTKLEEALPGTQVLFCAVATPPNEDYTADLRAVFSVCTKVAELTDHGLVFVNKSTVPVGTGKKCEELMADILAKRKTKLHIPVISNPEFLREGTAVADTLHPDRIVVGVDGDDAARLMMEELYRPLTRIHHPLVLMARESAEIVKYASNAFLAAKISFVNMLTELCEKCGGNILDVAKSMGLDERIGPRFLHAGIGYGGSCFPKDVKALIALGREHDVPLPIVQATHDINLHQRRRFAEKILAALPKKATIGIWGLTFKPNTDDMREAPSLDIIPLLLQAGHAIRAFDPVGMENAKKLLPSAVRFEATPQEAVTGADAVVLLTEWDVFRSLQLPDIGKMMKGKLLCDGRNVYEPNKVKEAGMEYVGIGIGA